MPIAKYTSSKGLFELTDGSSGFFVEDAPVAENQQTKAFSPALWTVTLVDDADTGTDTALAAAGGTAGTVGELIGDSFVLWDADGSTYFIWFDHDYAVSTTNTGPSAINEEGSTELSLTDASSATSAGTDDSENYPSAAADYDYVIGVVIAQSGGDVANQIGTDIAAAINAHATASTKMKALNTAGVLTVVMLTERTASTMGALYSGWDSQTLPSNGTDSFELASSPSNDYANTITNYGATSLTLTTDLGATYTCTTALDDGDYVGQAKYMYMSATPSNSAVLKVTYNSANYSEFYAADDFIFLRWSGTAWEEIADDGNAGMQ